MLKTGPAKYKKCRKRASLLDRGLAKYKRVLIEMKKDNKNSKMQIRNGGGCKAERSLVASFFWTY